MVGVVTSVGAERGLPELINRGYQVLFRPNESNHCPGCGRAQWYVGRVTAECVFCATALPLAESHWGESGTSARRAAPVHSAIEAVEAIDWAERRRHERVAAQGRVLQLLVDGSPQAFAVHNLSSGGAMVGSPAELVVAKSVELIAPDGELVPTTVRWFGNDLTGLQFARPVDLSASPKPND